MLCFCGYAQCSSRHYFGPAARPNYLIHYILSGKGVYQVGEKRYELQAGQGFLIEPEVLTFYQADNDDLSVRKWKRAEKNHIEYDEIKGNEHK